MNLKLYQGFGLVGIASALVTLVKIGLGDDPQEVIPTNITIGGVCFGMMMLLLWRHKRNARKITHG